MNKDERSGFCKHCNEQVVVFRPKPNHLLHFFITLIFFLLGFVSFGLGFGLAMFWIVVWLCLSIQIGGWRCNRCGSRKIGFLSVS